jgi:hypothetical protein
VRVEHRPGQEINEPWKEPISMSKLTPLASGQITPTDSITVVLVEPDDMPSSVIIHWPAAPTVCDPGRFPEAAASTVRLFSEAHITLARIKAWGRP